MANSVREDKLQAACTQWFWNTFPEHRRMLFHVDNNSYNAVIGARKKALGVVAGVSDLVLILFGEIIFIEAKDEDGTQSNEQKDFEAKVTERGHQYVIIREVEEFKRFVTYKIVRNAK